LLLLLLLLPQLLTVLCLLPLLLPLLLPWSGFTEGGDAAAAVISLSITEVLKLVSLCSRGKRITSTVCKDEQQGRVRDM
jgi:hypothetical protein